MKIAIISITDNGKKLSNKLKNLLDNDSTIINVDLFHKNVKENLKETFSNYDIIIGIMATGIMVRSICGLLKHKSVDPGIIIIDESDNFVISLLSGHLGRANEITLKIASLLNSTPVITTATDVQNKIGIDVLANEYYLDILNPSSIIYFNKSIIENKDIFLLLNDKINFFSEKYLQKTSVSTVIKYNELNKSQINFIKSFIKNVLKKPNKDNIYYKGKDIEFNIDDLENYLIFFTGEKDFLDKIDFKLDEGDSKLFNKNKFENFSNLNILILKPKKIVIGIGAKKNISKEKVLRAIKESTNELNIPISRINLLSTGSMKANEIGILEASKSLNIPIEILSFNDLSNFSFDNYSKSDFVEKNIGIKGVCEPSAILKAGEDSRLIYKKTAFNGVTIAIAVSK